MFRRGPLTRCPQLTPPAREDAEHVNEMAKLLIAHTDHEHPRVRYAALHALGQLANDQAPQFQDSWHTTVMPMLLTKFDDQVDRVASMAMSAFVSFGEELENALMMQYASGFMQKLVHRLQSTKHRTHRCPSVLASSGRTCRWCDRSSELSQGPHSAALRCTAMRCMPPPACGVVYLP